MCVERRKETGEVGLDTGIVRRKVLSCHLAFFEQEDRDRKSGVVATCAAEKVTALYIANDSGLPKNVDPAIEIGKVVGHMAALSARRDQLHERSNHHILTMICHHPGDVLDQGPPPVGKLRRVVKLPGRCVPEVEPVGDFECVLSGDGRGEHVNAEIGTCQSALGSSHRKRSSVQTGDGIGRHGDGGPE